MKLLISGFEPFGDNSENPSWEVAKQMLQMSDVDVEVCTCCLPVSFSRAGEEIKSAILQNNPDVVVMLGLATTRSMVTIERLAINIDDARHPDNDGYIPEDCSIIDNGPDAYFCTLPIKDVVKAVLQSGNQISISNSAGTYVCNHALYEALHLTKDTEVQVGFIHLPSFEEMSLDEMCGVVKITIETIKESRNEKNIIS